MSVDVFYIADSLGSYKEQSLLQTVELLHKHCPHELGLHAHDNLGLALSNSLLVLKSGFKWIDTTVTGMGRGPGNLHLELLLAALFSGAMTEKWPLLAQLIDKNFAPLKKQCGWGTNPYYAISAMLNVHPTYVQRLEEISNMSAEEKFQIISKLSSSQAYRFDAAKLSETINSE